ncbi:gp53-like domain-containing protein, partial [Cronobacter sakazakii]|uniref:gp53-like domain-containing protein n=1 Tax=Cronobacter sakazakii TaxID=28141 RepID=UPI001F510C48
MECASLALFRARVFFRFWVGLGEAAKRDVGTGLNQIPDMSSFGAGKGSTWYKLHPSGLIEMGGAIAVNGSAQAQKITVNYPIPFPNVCRGIWFSFQTEDPSQRFCGIYDRTSSLASFIASVVTPTVNTIY